MIIPEPCRRNMERAYELVTSELYYHRKHFSLLLKKYCDRRNGQSLQQKLSNNTSTVLLETYTWFKNELKKCSKFYSFFIGTVIAT